MVFEPEMLLRGRYRLVEPLAVGGMGELWRARDTVLDRPVAVKMLREEYAEDPRVRHRLRAEARHAAALTHPNVAHVYDLDEAGGDAPSYLVLELVDGEPLSHLISRCGPLSAAQVWSILAQTADALAAAHAAGLVHRDIKPANVLVRPDGLVKVTDFGISRALDDPAATQTGVLFATVHYVAPELLDGDAATPASDMYGLGVLAYECLTGRRPFSGDASQVLAAHRVQPPPPLPDTAPASLREVVTGLLAKDPSRRPPANHVAAQASAQIGRQGPLTALDGVALRKPTADQIARPAPAQTSTLISAPPTRSVLDPPSSVGTSTLSPPAGDYPPFPPLEPPQGGRSRSRRRRTQGVIAAAVAVVAAAGTAVGVVATRSNGREHASTPAARVASPTKHGGTQPSIPVQSVTLTGSPDDHPEDVSRVIDGDATTAWFTQHYTSPTFGGLRPGAGLVLDLGRSQKIRSMDVQLATPGVDLRVYAGSDQSTLLDTRPVASVDSVPANEDLRFDAPVDARYVLVWFTRLAPSDGAYRAGVDEISLHA